VTTTGLPPMESSSMSTMANRRVYDPVLFMAEYRDAILAYHGRAPRELSLQEDNEVCDTFMNAAAPFDEAISRLSLQAHRLGHPALG
jgi:hypothetical protein